MEFLNLARTRYTTKKYNSQNEISLTQIEDLKEILRLSPSSINSQPWKFTFVRDREVKNELASVSYFNEQKIRDASDIVVFSVVDSVQGFEEGIERRLPEGSVAYYRNFIKPKPEAEIQSWLEHQVYLSLGFFLGACASMEIDSTPMEGIKNEEYARILQLDGYRPLFAVALGYRDVLDANQPEVKPKMRLPLPDVAVSVL